MRTTTYSEFRRHARRYLDAVQSGETIRLTRRGQPIADIVPAREDAASSGSRRPALLKEIPGLCLSRMILDERSELAR